MERMIIKKVMVISQEEESSLEVPFEPGLNIIYGGNKTGKSSIIKSIFKAFGCECRRVETEWKKLISAYLVFFQYGSAEYCICNEKNEYHVFRVEKDEFECLISTQHFHEYSNKLMQILEVNMPCISNKGKTFNITPPLLFRFQYIDQDSGWYKIGDSFSNTNYIKDWTSNTNKYVVGYLDETYYEARAKVAQLEIKKNELRLELIHNEQFVEKLRSILQWNKSTESPEELESRLKESIESLSEYRLTKLDLEERINNIENEIYIGHHKLNLAEINLRELSKDIDFAMRQDEELICPTCGMRYCNGLIEQLTISVDGALNEKLVMALNEKQREMTETLGELKKQYEEIIIRIDEKSSEIKKTQKLIEYSEFYRNEGKNELFESCLEQLEILQKQINDYVIQIVSMSEEIDALKSRKRATKIRKEIERHCREMAEILDIPNTFIKLKDFVQVINKTGSETPRLVYMYQSALYNFNLQRSDSPFNFLVIDTPNQQGQDEINLGNIHASLGKFITTEGQVILGTERETGYENVASTVLKLREKRKCLSKESFGEHVGLLNLLLGKARVWVRENVNEE